MGLFVVSVALVLCVSAFCSLSEAALYSVRMPYIRQVAAEGASSGRILESFKRNMERPITAILIVNTAANTAGATVAGAQAGILFGETAVIWFTVIFTLAVLFLSEILPKVAGVTYSNSVARAVSLPWALMIKMLQPLVWASQQASSWVSRDQPQALAPEEEVHQVAQLSAEEGSILPMEAALVKNVLELDQVTARDIMTPRTVVFRLVESATVGDVAEQVVDCPHSRIPVHPANDSDHWPGFVFRADVLEALARDEFDKRLSELRKPLDFLLQQTPAHRMLKDFLERRHHLMGVMDEYGGTQGLVSLEDVLETLLGAEIVDETDRVADLQRMARHQARRP
ncbi:MAG: hemolysin family protein [Thermoanaerobaculia bacterium]|nr:hemolysin family protein [Thermoanaerobaculia bacterium]